MNIAARIAILAAISLAAATSGASSVSSETRIQTHLLWEAVDGEEFLLGTVSDVALHANGNLLVLDSQQIDIKVFSSNGILLGIVPFEGEGPGELRDPSKLACLPDGSIAARQYSHPHVALTVIFPLCWRLFQAPARFESRPGFRMTGILRA